jgi:arylsulfatase A-like enzyme
MSRSIERLVFCSLLLSLGACSPSSDERRPNILLVVLDTTRADVLSSYGHPKPTTPHLDQLASEGVRFTRAFAVDFWTLPSHASLLTGQYPTDHKATSETNHLPGRADTLAERLRLVGYRTGAYVGNPWLSEERGFSQGFDTYVEMWRQAPRGLQERVLERKAAAGASAWMTRDVEGNQPFFLFVNLNRAHLPYSPDPLVLAGLTPQARPMDRVARLKKVKGTWAYLAGAARFDETDFQIMHELYEAEVAMVDARVGKLIGALRESGILDRTLVIVTSDHGENIGEHGMIDHFLSMYETTIQVPLIMRYPSRFAAGTVSHALVSLVDIYPTVLDICGLGKGDPDTAARSLANADRVAPAFVIAENDRPINGIKRMESAFPSFDTSTIDQRMRMLRTDRYKLVWYENEDAQLFDLESDPDEQRDLASSEPAIRDQLLDDLMEWMESRAGGEEVEAFEGRDPRAEERLRALGYIE